MMNIWSRRSFVFGATALAATPAYSSIDARSFGVFADGVSDDTAGLQRAIDALGPEGGTLRLPKGIYRVRDRYRSGACLTARCGIRLIGDGAMQTIIRPETPGSDALLIAPNPNWSAAFTLVEGVFIGDNRTGSRIGRHGIHAVTSSRATLPHFGMRDTFVGQGEGASFVHKNSVDDNQNGGLYAATIVGCSLSGGIILSGSGDSIVVRENILTGEGIGVDVDLVPGASLLSIIDNNITSRRGAVRVVRGSRVNILRNNCEHQQLAVGGVSVDLGGVSRMDGGVVADNLLSCFTGTRFAALLRLRNRAGITITGNSFAAGSAGVAGVLVEEGCLDVRFGPNLWNANVVPRLADKLRVSRGNDPANDPRLTEAAIVTRR